MFVTVLDKRMGQKRLMCLLNKSILIIYLLKPIIVPIMKLRVHLVVGEPQLPMHRNFEKKAIITRLGLMHVIQMPLIIEIRLMVIPKSN